MKVFYYMRNCYGSPQVIIVTAESAARALELLNRGCDEGNVDLRKLEEVNMSVEVVRVLTPPNPNYDAHG